MEGLTSTFPVNGCAAKQTCKQCRLRKVRCLAEPRGVGSCRDCERLRFACSFVEQSSNGSSRNGATVELEKPEPRRVSRACLRCREHKIRCSGGHPCATCRGKEASCEYSVSARPPPRRSKHLRSLSRPISEKQTEEIEFNAPPSLTGVIEEEKAATPQLPSFEVMTENTPDTGGSSQSMATQMGELSALMGFFFEHVYPLPSYAFLHPATTWRRFAQGRLEPCLLYAIMAIASVRSPLSQRRQEMEPIWAERTETFIWQNLESPSLARLQATLLIILFRAETGYLRRAFMLSALAGRAAVAMRLNYERPDGNKITLEVRRRLMWSLKLVERYFSTGLPEFELCPLENLYIQLPCHEYEFNGEEQGSRLSDDLGAYHMCVELEMLRRDVMKLTRSLALCDEPYPQLPKVMRNFQLHLDKLGTQLPGGPELTAEGMRDLLDNRWLPRHMLMRLSWHECHCDLNRLLLRRFREAAPEVVIDGMEPSVISTAEDICIHHARAIVLILGTINNECQQARLLEFDTAICAYNASRLLLFTARFGRSNMRPTDEFALSRAELCFAALRRFFPESKLVRPVLGEIRRLIDEFVSRTTLSPSRLGSPRIAVQHLPEPTKQLSFIAKRRQRLAVHSLLRQAGFSDEEDEPEDGRFDGSPSSALAAQHVSPGIASATSAAAVAGSDQLGHNQARTMSIGGLEQTTPETQVDSESWMHDFFAGGDLLHGREFENNEASSAKTPGSFIFPWLQRDQGE